MSKDLSQAAHDAFFKKGLEDAKEGNSSQPNNKNVFESLDSAIFDSKEEKELKKAENDAYWEGYRVGQKTR